MKRKPLTFVLVHGAWHGAWCWRRLADILQAEGHRVFAPALAGVGERAHELSREISLDTHISDVVDVFEREVIGSAVLCAHSYGGWPVSGALEIVEARVSAIVFVDAHMPQDGQRGVDTSNGRDDIERDWKMGKSGRAPRGADYLLVNEKDRDWVNDMLTDQPLGVSFQPIRLTGARERIATKIYIRAPRFKSDAFDDALSHARRNGWQIHGVGCGHDVMIDEPARLAGILTDLP